MAQVTVETIEGSRVGHPGSLVLDSNGDPHIVYATVDGEVRCGRKVAGAWVSENIHMRTSTTTEDRICIAVDSHGDQHIAFKDRDSGHLVYGVKQSAWTLEEVPTRGGTLARGVAHISFQLHPGKVSPEQRDAPHLSFHDTLNSALGHIVKTGERWHPTLIEDPDIRSAGLFTSLAIDVEERIRIAYFEGGEGHLVLKMAELLDGQWARDVLDDEIEGESASFARGTFGRTYIAYFDRKTGSVKAWVHSFDLPAPRKEIVIAGLSLPTAPSAAANPEGELRVAYSDGQLRLGLRDRFGVWTSQTIDASAAGSPSLAYDKNGSFHMTYAVGSALKYARGTE